MDKTFFIYKIERHTFKNEIVFETISRKEAEEKYSQLNSELNEESKYSYRMTVK
jgi:hypothetical protein